MLWILNPFDPYSAVYWAVMSITAATFLLLTWPWLLSSITAATFLPFDLALVPSTATGSTESTKSKSQISITGSMDPTATKLPEIKWTPFHPCKNYFKFHGYICL